MAQIARCASFRGFSGGRKCRHFLQFSILISHNLQCLLRQRVALVCICTRPIGDRLFDGVSNALLNVFSDVNRPGVFCPPFGLTPMQLFGSD